MYRFQLLDHGAQRRRESLVRAACVGPHGVATSDRYNIRDQERCRGRALHERDVGVPAGVATALCAIEHEDLRMIRMTWHHRMRRRGLTQ